MGDPPHSAEAQAPAGDQRALFAPSAHRPSIPEELTLAAYLLHAGPLCYALCPVRSVSARLRVRTMLLGDPSEVQQPRVDCRCLTRAAVGPEGLERW